MKGVILAAGKGTRMSSITYGVFPKEFLPIGNVPTIRFPVEAVKLAGINQLFIVVAPHTKHAILDALQSGKRFGVNICYVVQEEEENGLTGIGIGILTTENWMGDDDFLVACGDTILGNFSSENPLNCLQPMIKLHSQMDALSTVLVFPVSRDISRFGIVKFKEILERDGVLFGQVEGLIEKPDLKLAKSYKSNGHYFAITGYYAFKANIFEYIGKTKPSLKNEVQITDAMKLALQNNEKTFAVIHGRRVGDDIVPFTYWDVGIPDDYKKANEYLLRTKIYDKLRKYSNI